MPDIYFKSVPFSKEDVTLALESGVDGIITEAEHVEGVRSLALCDVRAEADMPSVGLGSKAEEESIASRIAGGERLVLAQGWEIIPVENLLAQPAVAGKLAVEVASLAEARLAAGVLECGVPVVVVLPEALASLKNIVSELKLSQGTLTLDKLEAMTCVCSVGLDMIAVPGDTSAQTLSAIIADEAAIGMVNTKTTAVRLIPAPGLKVGDTVDFGGLLGSAPIMPVHGESAAAFIARGGRIPAPMHSLKN